MFSSYDIPLDDLFLSVGTYNCLKRAEVYSATDLLALPVEGIANIRQLGRKRLAELCDALEDYAYRFLPELEHELFRTRISTLGLSSRIEEDLTSARITTLAVLATIPRAELSDWLGPKEATALLAKMWAYVVARVAGLAEPRHSPSATREPVSALESHHQFARTRPRTKSDVALSSLDLSTRAYNALRRAGIDTLGELISMSLVEIGGIRNIGRKGLAEIEDVIHRYAHLVQIEAGLEEPAASPGRSIDDLELPEVTRMELRDGGIVTVDDLTTLSEESLIAHHGIRWEDVCAIKAVLFEKGLALTVEQPLYPMVDPDLMAVAEQKHVPLDRLPLKRLAIPENWEARLTEAGLTAIGPLAEASWVVLQARCFGRYPKAIDTMRLQLKRYIAWVVQQDAWDEQVLDQGITAALGTELSRTSLNDVVSELLRSLPEKREGEIIALRFGLYDGEPKTLEEIGQLYGISRERVRQIQRQAMHRLRHPSRKSMKALLTDFLEAILIQSGGLARTGYLADVLKDNIPHAGLSVRKAVRFFCTMDSRFVELSSEGAWDTWGVADYPVEYVQSINRSMADILAEKGVPTSETELLLEFKESPLYLAIQKDVTDQFVYACLHANPRIQVSKDGYCALRRQIRRQTSYPRKPKRQIDEIDELIWRWREEGLTLAEIGRRLGGISRQAALSRIIRTGWHFEDHGGTGGHTP